MTMWSINSIAAFDHKNDQNTVVAEQLKQDSKADSLSNIFDLFYPNYILPYYYTADPYQKVYKNHTPDNQNVMSSELYAQLSFRVPVVKRLLAKDTSLHIAYTQNMFWQFYAKSQYFRETNYQPEIFIEKDLSSSSLARLSLNHQSNGRGGDLERSWNRAIVTFQTSGTTWLLDIKAWALLFKSASSDLHNPRIAHYLGHEIITLSKRFKSLVLSVEAQNIESGLKRGHIALTASYPLTKNFKLFTRVFNGYGQSLIEYDNKTFAAGVGIAFNDWISAKPRIFKG